MINRINLILRAKNITARQFAEEIGIQPSGMSHILGGRNNPSLDFAVKVLKRYPEIDANWLLLGKGAMYGSSGQQVDDSTIQQVVESTVRQMDDVNLFSQPREEVKTYEPVEEPRPKVEDYQATYVAVPPKEVARQESVEEEEPLEDEPKPVRMMLIYSDNTYEVLTPRC